MNRQQFFLWMKDPASLNSDSIRELQQLTGDYPYFQSARLLHLLNLKLMQDYRFEQELPTVAAFIPDRARLRDWLAMLDEKETGRDKSGTMKDESLNPSAIKPDMEEHLKNIEEQIKASLDEIEFKKSRLRELIEEKKAIVGDIDNQAEDLQDKKKDFPLRPLPKDELLEEFLRQRQGQSQGRVTFYNPDESARKSIEENDEILSETLARLIAAQGKNDKAIKIYQKLMLKYPQKSSYFAAQIEKLRKES